MRRGILLVLVAAGAGCMEQEILNTSVGNVPKELVVTSPAFPAGAPIPVRFTCDGENVSPPLHVQNLPAGTNSLALLMDRTGERVGTRTHWLVFNIPANHSHIEPGQDLAAVGARLGATTDGTLGYDGPCPKRGPHQYFLRVFALNDSLPLPQGVLRPEFEQAMVGHVLSWGETMGTYRRG